MKKVIALVLAAMMVLSLVACGAKKEEAAAPAAEQKTEASSKELTDVVFVLPRSLECLDDAHIWAAIEMGYFEEEGINCVLQEAASGDTKMVSVGQAQICTPAPMGLMSSVEAGMDLISVFQHDTTQIFGIGVKEDSDMKVPADMKGKTIVLGDPSWQTEFEPYVAAAGLSLDDVTFVNGGENRAQMVSLGQGDCVYTWEKEYQLWQAQGLDIRYISFQDIYPACANSLCVSRDYYNNNKDTITKFCRAIAKGMYFAKCNPMAAAQIVTAKYPALGLTAEQALPAIEGLVRITNDADTEQYGYGYHNKDEWELNKKGGLEIGVLTKDAPVEDFYTNEFVEEINKFDHDKVKADAENYTK